MTANPHFVAGAYQEAVGMVRQGELQRAEAICHEILRAQSGHADTLLLRGVIELRTGRSASGIASFRRSINSNPANAIAHALLGDALLESNQPQEALDSYERALGVNPGLVPALFGRANALLDLHRPLDALASYDALLRLQPDNPEALFNRGNALFELQKHEAALESFDRAIALNPVHAAARNNRGSVLMSARRFDEALASFDAAIAADPGFVFAFRNRGTALRELARPKDALEAFDRALEHRADYADAHAGRGDALLDLQRPEEALAAHDRAVFLNAGSPEAHLGRGNSLCALRRIAEAAACYEEAERLDPGNAAAAYNLGKLHLEGQRPLDALACFDRALRRKNDFAAALCSRADALQALERPEAAAECLAELLRMEPERDYAAGALLHAQQGCADWSVKTAAAGCEMIHRAVLAKKRADSPFSFLAVADDPIAQLQCAKTFVADRCPSVAPLWVGGRYRHERLRVAYVSPDFREHAVSYLLTGVLERHDRRRFETIGVSLRPEEQSRLGRRVKQAFGRFVDASGESDRAVAELMRSLEVDIAVDLAGFTDGLRPQIFSHRPAPIQVQYLGYPGTMGAPFIDYLMADAFVVPAEAAALYSEQIVYLPHCFQANDDQRTISRREITREAAGLPREGFVFCCFNNTYKLNSTMFDIWMRLLDRVPRSVLWLVGANETVRANLRHEAARRGADPGRLVFAARAPYAEHLNRLGLADLFLDTLPFNGGATASDALWAGLPLLTCAGKSFAARMAGSLVRAAGLPELATADLEAYETMAVELAGQPEALLALRRRLQETRHAAPLFDTDLFRRHLETAYEQMWERHDRGAAPGSFSVDA